MEMRSSLLRYYIILLLLASLVGVAFASVFVYYPIEVSVSPVGPPVYFEAGANAGGGDLAGNTIGVTVGSNGASLNVTLHPTYQKTYYKGVAKITNSDSNAYYITVRVVSTFLSLPSGSVALLRIYDGSSFYNVDLTSTGDTTIGQISAGASWRIDFYFYIPEGSTLPTSDSASVQLIYSPSAESPSSLP